MILELQLEIVSLERCIDDLTVIRENVSAQLDTLAQIIETKRGMLAFESTEYTPAERMPVNFFGLDDHDADQSIV
jgi:hypothetical protein